MNFAVITNVVIKRVHFIVPLFFSGPRPQESKGSLIRIPLSLDKSTTYDAIGGWEAKVDEVKGKTVVVTIMTEPDSNIGKYESFVETKLKDSSKEGFTLYEYDGYFYMLFNPWCKGLYIHKCSASEGVTGII